MALVGDVEARLDLNTSNFDSKLARVHTQLNDLGKRVVKPTVVAATQAAQNAAQGANVATAAAGKTQTAATQAAAAMKRYDAATVRASAATTEFNRIMAQPKDTRNLQEVAAVTNQVRRAYSNLQRAVGDVGGFGALGTRAGQTRQQLTSLGDAMKQLGVKARSGGSAAAQSTAQASSAITRSVTKVNDAFVASGNAISSFKKIAAQPVESRNLQQVALVNRQLASSYRTLQTAATNAANRGLLSPQQTQVITLRMGELQSAMTQLRGGTQQVGTVVQQAGQAAAASESNFAMLFRTLIKASFVFAGIMALKAAIDALGQSIRLVVTESVRFEQLQIGFEQLYGGIDQATKMLGELARFAATTPFELRDLEQQAMRLKAYGFSAREVIPLLTDVGDATSALGTGAEGINRITLALGQMRSAGRVNSRDMLQLTEAFVPAWQYIADALGTTTGKVREMTEKGLIPADIAIKAIRSGMQQDFGGLMARQMETLGGMWSNLVDKVTLTARAVGGSLLPKFKAWVDEASRALPRIQKFLEETVAGTNDLGAALQTVAGAFRLLWDIMKPLLGWLKDLLGMITALVGGRLDSMWRQMAKHPVIAGVAIMGMAKAVAWATKSVFALADAWWAVSAAQGAAAISGVAAAASSSGGQAAASGAASAGAVAGGAFAGGFIATVKRIISWASATLLGGAAGKIAIEFGTAAASGGTLANALTAIGTALTPLGALFVSLLGPLALFSGGLAAVAYQWKQMIDLFRDPRNASFLTMPLPSETDKGLFVPPSKRPNKFAGMSDDEVNALYNKQLATQAVTDAETALADAEAVYGANSGQAELATVALEQARRNAAKATDTYTASIEGANGAEKSQAQLSLTAAQAIDAAMQAAENHEAVMKQFGVTSWESSLAQMELNAASEAAAQAIAAAGGPIVTSTIATTSFGDAAGYASGQLVTLGVSAVNAANQVGTLVQQYMLLIQTAQQANNLAGGIFYSAGSHGAMNSTTSKFSAQLRGLDPAFAAQVQMLLDAVKGAGYDLSITSTTRSYAQQKALWEAYQRGEIGLAAKPGSSRHERGLAVDFSGSPEAIRYAAQVAKMLGLESLARLGDAGHFQQTGPARALEGAAKAAKSASNSTKSAAEAAARAMERLRDALKGAVDSARDLAERFRDAVSRIGNFAGLFDRPERKRVGGFMGAARQQIRKLERYRDALQKLQKILPASVFDEVVASGTASMDEVIRLARANPRQWAKLIEKRQGIARQIASITEADMLTAGRKEIIDRTYEAAKDAGVNVTLNMGGVTISGYKDVEQFVKDMTKLIDRELRAAGLVGV